MPVVEYSAQVRKTFSPFFFQCLSVLKTSLAAAEVGFPRVIETVVLKDAFCLRGRNTEIAYLKECTWRRLHRTLSWTCPRRTERLVQSANFVLFVRQDIMSDRPGASRDTSRCYLSIFVCHIFWELYFLSPWSLTLECWTIFFVMCCGGGSSGKS